MQLRRNWCQFYVINQNKCENTLIDGWHTHTKCLILMIYVKAIWWPATEHWTGNHTRFVSTKRTNFNEKNDCFETHKCTNHSMSSRIKISVRYTYKYAKSCQIITRKIFSCSFHISSSSPSPSDSHLHSIFKRIHFWLMEHLCCVIMTCNENEFDSILTYSQAHSTFMGSRKTSFLFRNSFPSFLHLRFDLFLLNLDGTNDKKMASRRE